MPPCKLYSSPTLSQTTLDRPVSPASRAEYSLFQELRLVKTLSPTIQRNSIICARGIRHNVLMGPPYGLDHPADLKGAQASLHSQPAVRAERNTHLSILLSDRRDRFQHFREDSGQFHDAMYISGLTESSSFVSGPSRRSSSIVPGFEIHYLSRWPTTMTSILPTSSRN